MTLVAGSDWLRERVSQTRDGEALRWVRGDDATSAEVWTWRQLYEHANQAAQYLDAVHGESLRRILLICEDARNLVVLINACWLTGRLPIVASHRLTWPEREQAIRSSGCSLWIRENDDTNIVMTRVTPVWDAPGDPPAALGVFTSGTTGTPRLAELGRRALDASARASAQVLGAEPADRWLAAMPMTHIGGISILIRCVVQGACVVMDPWRDAARLVEVAHAQRATLVSVVPTMLHRIVSMGDAGRAPSSVRATLVGGAAAQPRDVQEAAALGWSPRLTWGLTEAASQVATSPSGVAVPTTCGWPLPGIGLRVRNAGPDRVGELVVSGDTLFDGYRRHDGILERPPADGFATGDLGRLDPDGLRVFLRRDDLIVTGGENVYPAEVEAALKELPGVADCAVVGVDDAEWGQRVAAVVVPRGADGPDVGTLRSLLALRLAHFKLPRRIVVRASIPRTESGKVIRAEVRRWLMDEEAQDE